jgi:hypothetical protein
MNFGLVLLLSFVFGFVVGHFVAVPVGAMAWGGWLYYDDHQHPHRPRLEGTLDRDLPIVSIAMVAVAILAGYALRWGVRYAMQRR